MPKLLRNSQLATASMVSATLASALTAIGSSGIVYLGVIYVPLETFYIAFIPYFFICLSIVIVYFTVLREKDGLTILSTIIYLIGFYFSLISAITLMELNVFENYLSFIIDSALIISGSTYIFSKYNFLSKIYAYFKDREVIDKLAVSLAFLILGVSRLLIREIYLPIPLTFLILSWIVTFIILKNSPLLRPYLISEFELITCCSVIFGLINMAYLVILRTSL